MPKKKVEKEEPIDPVEKSFRESFGKVKDLLNQASKADDPATTLTQLLNSLAIQTSREAKNDIYDAASKIMSMVVKLLATVEEEEKAQDVGRQFGDALEGMMLLLGFSANDEETAAEHLVKLLKGQRERYKSIANKVVEPATEEMAKILAIDDVVTSSAIEWPEEFDDDID